MKLQLRDGRIVDIDAEPVAQTQIVQYQEPTELYYPHPVRPQPVPCPVNQQINDWWKKLLVGVGGFLFAAVVLSFFKIIITPPQPIQPPAPQPNVVKCPAIQIFGSCG